MRIALFTLQSQHTRYVSQPFRMGLPSVVQVHDVSPHLVIGLVGLCSASRGLLLIEWRNVLEYRARSREDRRGEMHALVQPLGIVPGGGVGGSNVVANLPRGMAQRPAVHSVQKPNARAAVPTARPAW